MREKETRDDWLYGTAGWWDRAHTVETWWLQTKTWGSLNGTELLKKLYEGRQIDADENPINKRNEMS